VFRRFRNRWSEAAEYAIRERNHDKEDEIALKKRVEDFDIPSDKINISFPVVKKRDLEKINKSFRKLEDEKKYITKKFKDLELMTNNNDLLNTLANEAIIGNNENKELTKQAEIIKTIVTKHSLGKQGESLDESAFGAKKEYAHIKEARGNNRDMPYNDHLTIEYDMSRLRNILTRWDRTIETFYKVGEEVSDTEPGAISMVTQTDDVKVIDAVVLLPSAKSTSKD